MEKLASDRGFTQKDIKDKMSHVKDCDRCLFLSTLTLLSAVSPIGNRNTPKSDEYKNAVCDDFRKSFRSPQDPHSFLHPTPSNNYYKQNTSHHQRSRSSEEGSQPKDAYDAQGARPKAKYTECQRRNDTRRISDPFNTNIDVKGTVRPQITSDQGSYSGRGYITKQYNTPRLNDVERQPYIQSYSRQDDRTLNQQDTTNIVPRAAPNKRHQRSKSINYDDQGYAYHSYGSEYGECSVKQKHTMSEPIGQRSQRSYTSSKNDVQFYQKNSSPSNNSEYDKPQPTVCPSDRRSQHSRQCNLGRQCSVEQSPVKMDSAQFDARPHGANNYNNSQKSQSHITQARPRGNTSQNPNDSRSPKNDFNAQRDLTSPTTTIAHAVDRTKPTSTYTVPSYGKDNSRMPMTVSAGQMTLQQHLPNPNIIHDPHNKGIAKLNLTKPSAADQSPQRPKTSPKVQSTHDQSPSLFNNQQSTTTQAQTTTAIERNSTDSGLLLTSSAAGNLRQPGNGTHSTPNDSVSAAGMENECQSGNDLRLEDIPDSKLDKLYTLLNYPCHAGYSDWRMVAEKLGIDRHHITDWDARPQVHTNPGKKTLDAWKHKSGATVGILRTLFDDMDKAAWTRELDFVVQQHIAALQA